MTQSDRAEAAVARLTDSAFAAAMAPFAISDHAHIAVAVSGGPDSIALLRLLQVWAVPRGIRLTALTVDHRLRAAAADEVRQVAQWCADLGIAHAALRWDEGAALIGVGRSPQAEARDARYRLMGAWCRAEGVAVLCLAHHADDQVETFLMRLARGSGVDGLAAMLPETTRHGVRLLRPLLQVSKDALRATCTALGQAWIEDPSNQNTAATRVRFRQARALLAAEGLDDTRLLRTVSHMQRAREALRRAVEALLLRICHWDDYGVARIELAGLVQAADDVGLRALASVLCTASGAVYAPRFERLERVYRALRNGPWRDATLHGCGIFRVGGDILICRETAAIVAETETEIVPGTEAVWDGRFEIALSPAAPTPVRIVAAGDWATAARAPQVARAARGSLPLVIDGAGPLCLAPFPDSLREDAKGAWDHKIVCRFHAASHVVELQPFPEM